MNKTVVANWKANPSTLAEAQELFSRESAAASEYPEVRTIICPPFVFLEELAKLSSFRGLGSQDIFWDTAGPYTGEITPDMLVNFRVGSVLIGHSDRRYVVGETDEVINKKIKAALENEITPILLVGEREKGDAREDVLVDQLSRNLEHLTTEDVAKVVVAYEPVWAISTGKQGEAATPESAKEAIILIQNILQRSFGVQPGPILYGGSVTPYNAESFFSVPEIGGAVVGGASLRPDEFAKIVEVASRT